MQPADLWIPGIRPVQFLIVIAVLFFAGIGLQRILTRIGWRITMFWQVLLAWIVCYIFLTLVVSPVLPFHLLANYLGVITLALFLYAGATESGWQECRDTILGMLRGRTLGHRIARVGVFVALPVGTYAGLHQQMIPVFDVPREFRAYHMPPPRAFTARGATYFNQSAGPTWVGKEEAHPTPKQHAASVTLHIPPHLVDLAGGYTRVQIVESGIDLERVLNKVEAAFPSLHNDLRRAPGGGATHSSVNFFVVDQDGRFVGTNTYSVGGRSNCCTAKIWTEVPPGSDVYILPKGHAIDATRIDRGLPPQSVRSPDRRKPLDEFTLRAKL